MKTKTKPDYTPTFLQREGKLLKRLAAIPNHLPVPTGDEPKNYWTTLRRPSTDPRYRSGDNTLYLSQLAMFVEWQEREAKPKVEKPVTKRYWALHKDGLRNGSFFRQQIKHHTIAQYVNGDAIAGCGFQSAALSTHGFLATGPIVDGVPTTYYDKPLIEYPQHEAERLIPTCCGGKH